jgi:hypothetical protein
MKHQMPVTFYLLYGAIREFLGNDAPPGAHFSAFFKYYSVFFRTPWGIRPFDSREFKHDLVFTEPI